MLTGSLILNCILTILCVYLYTIKIRPSGKFVGYVNIYKKRYGLHLSSVPKKTRRHSRRVISGVSRDLIGVGEVYIKNIE